MNKEEAIEILSEMQSEYNLFGDEEEATRYHVLSWAIKEMNGKPVKHGHWVRHLDTRFGRKLNDIIICSRCGCAFSTEDMIHRSYCPNCGSKMDEGYPNALKALDALEEDDETCI